MGIDWQSILGAVENVPVLGTAFEIGFGAGAQAAQGGPAPNPLGTPGSGPIGAIPILGPAAQIGASIGASGAAPAPSAAAQAAPRSQGAYTLRWLVAWSLVLVLFLLAVRTRFGYATAYYLVALCLILLLVTQYRWVASALSPITGLSSPARTPAA